MQHKMMVRAASGKFSFCLVPVADMLSYTQPVGFWAAIEQLAWKGTQMTEPDEGPRTGTPQPSALSGWGWFIALGVVLIGLGLYAIAHVLWATITSIMVIGMLMIVGGVTHIVLAFRGKDWTRFMLLVAGGVLYLLAGALIFADPVLASTVLTLIIAFALLAAGGARLWFGFAAPAGSGRGWMISTGVITLLLGLVIATGWPVDSLWVIGMFLAIDLLVQGWSYIAFGLTLRGRN